MKPKLPHTLWVPFSLLLACLFVFAANGQSKVPTEGVLYTVQIGVWKTSSLVQLSLNEFCDISNPEVATPPALEAFPGENNISCD